MDNVNRQQTYRAALERAMTDIIGLGVDAQSAERLVRLAIDQFYQHGPFGSESDRDLPPTVVSVLTRHVEPYASFLRKSNQRRLELIDHDRTLTPAEADELLSLSSVVDDYVDNLPGIDSERLQQLRERYLQLRPSV